MVGVSRGKNVGIFVFLNFYVANRLDVRECCCKLTGPQECQPDFQLVAECRSFNVCWEIKPVYSFEAASKCHQQCSVQMGKGAGRGLRFLATFC